MIRPLSYQFDLISNLVRRNFRLRYKGSVLGVLWSFLLPLSQLLVLAFLFGKVVPLGIADYPAFVFSALLPWNWFSSSVGSAAKLFVGSRDLLRQPHFEPAILIIVNTLSHLITYALSLPILFVILALYGNLPSFSLLLLPFLLLLQGLLIVGASLIVGTLNVFYRDVEYIVTMMLMLLFYMTPVFYQPGSVSASYRFLYIINPMAVLVQCFRALFLNDFAPEWSHLLVAGTICIVVFICGCYTYKYQLHKVFDVI